MESVNVKRGKWQSEPEYLSACLGVTIGVGTLSRLPYLAYRGGGILILLPYFVMLILMAIPLLYMELTIGQCLEFGPIQTIGRICPLFKMTGYVIVLLTFIVSTYHNAIGAWALHYLTSCFKRVLPWTVCPANTTTCISSAEDMFNSSSSIIYNDYDYEYGNIPLKKIPASQYYFENEVIRVSSGLDDPGYLNGEMTMYLLLVWSIVFLCLFKGVNVLGKIMYVTTGLPYILMFILLLRAITLPGAWVGIAYYILPSDNVFHDILIWKDVCLGIVYGIGLGSGVMITFASYSKKQNNVFADTLFISLVSFITSFVGGFLVFSVVGHIALRDGIEIDRVMTGGLHLVFTVFNDGLSTIPGGRAWLIMFYLSFFLMILGSQFGLVEVVVVSFMDWLQTKYSNSNLRMIVVALVCLTSFLLSLPYMLQSGIYTFILMDYHIVFYPVIVVLLFEILAVCYVFGSWKLVIMSQGVLRQTPPYFFYLIWRVTPMYILLAAFALSVGASFRQSVAFGDYVFPLWTSIIAGIVDLLILMTIPNFMFYKLIAMQLKEIRTNFKTILSRSLNPNMEYLVPEWSRASYVELKCLPMASEDASQQPSNSREEHDPLLQSHHDDVEDPPPPQYEDIVVKEDKVDVETSGV